MRTDLPQVFSVLGHEDAGQAQLDQQLGGRRRTVGRQRPCLRISTGAAPFRNAIVSRRVVHTVRTVSALRLSKVSDSAALPAAPDSDCLD